VAGAAVAGETAEAAGVVAEGAVADSIVVLGVEGVVVGAALACPNIFAIRLVNIPISSKVRFRAPVWMHPGRITRAVVGAAYEASKEARLKRRQGEGWHSAGVRRLARPMR